MNHIYTKIDTKNLINKINFLGKKVKFFGGVKNGKKVTKTLLNLVI